MLGRRIFIIIIIIYFFYCRVYDLGQSNFCPDFYYYYYYLFIFTAEYMTLDKVIFVHFVNATNKWTTKF